MRVNICMILFLACLAVRAHAIDPPPGYPRDMGQPPFWFMDQPGPFDEKSYADRRPGFRFSHERIRGVYDAVGLPVLGSTGFRKPHPKLRWSPLTLRDELIRHGMVASYPEKWTIHLNGQLGITWMANGILRDPKPPYDQAPTYLKSAWNGTPEIHFRGTELDTSVTGVEYLTIESWGKIGIGKGLSGTRRYQLHGRELRWDLLLDRHGLTTPKPKLADLKKVAPFFYEYIPDYVLERAAFFDRGSVRSISVYALGGMPTRTFPHILEISGSFSFENERGEHTFDSYFEPDVFRRIHCADTRFDLRRGQFQLTYPLRKADVMVVEGSSRGSCHVRFLVDPRYDPIRMYKASSARAPAIAATQHPAVTQRYNPVRLQQDLRDNKRIMITVPETPPPGDEVRKLKPAATYRIFAYDPIRDEVSLLATDSNHHVRLSFNRLIDNRPKWSIK